MKPARLPGLRRLPGALGSVQPGTALFESWHGQVADSPRAIAEELTRRALPIDQVWVRSDPEARAEGSRNSVAPGSYGYLKALRTAQYIFCNSTLPGYFRKRRGTTYVQTWHGTPLKRIAFDVPRPSAAVSPRQLRHLAREVAAWDFLVSPNRFSTDVLRRAFRFEGEVLETGYPRNDLLRSAAAPAVRDAVRAELGIKPGARATLYAPTWRDGEAFSLRLDLEALHDALGDSHHLLLRTHHLDRLEDARRHPNVIDVSSRPDIRELYLAADVLITDYSSVMFDFAVTGKPILFFTYDLERYRDEIRGFYFDFVADPPGPLLRTSPEVVGALTRLDGIVERHREAYARFRERFCHLDDGHASQRVVEAVLGASA